MRRGLPELGETGWLMGKCRPVTRPVGGQRAHADQSTPNQLPSQGLNKAAIEPKSERERVSGSVVSDSL